MKKENTDLEPGRRLTAEDFKRLTAKHVQEAARVVASGTVKRRFRDSTDYDVVLDDGKRLAPKEVLGVAARLGLGLDVGPSHFRGGEGTPCFRTIRAAGLRIEPKKVDTKVPMHLEDEWFEGHLKRALHLTYERNRKAVRKKKDALREERGRLECEECGFVPSSRYEGDSGDACIEVHHKIPLASLRKKLKKTPKDLVCVCANCHRVLHYLMREEARMERSV